MFFHYIHHFSNSTSYANNIRQKKPKVLSSLASESLKIHITKFSTLRGKHFKHPLKNTRHTNSTPGEGESLRLRSHTASWEKPTGCPVVFSREEVFWGVNGLRHCWERRYPDPHLARGRGGRTSLRDGTGAERPRPQGTRGRQGSPAPLGRALSSAGRARPRAGRRRARRLTPARARTQPSRWTLCSLRGDPCALPPAGHRAWPADAAPLPPAIPPLRTEPLLSPGSAGGSASPGSWRRYPACPAPAQARPCGRSGRGKWHKQP